MTAMLQLRIKQKLFQYKSMRKKKYFQHHSLYELTEGSKMSQHPQHSQSVRLGKGELILGLAPECWKFPTEPNFTAESSTPEKKGGLLEILRDAGGDYDKPSGARFLLGGAYCVGLMHKTSCSAGTLPRARYFSASSM